MKFDSPLFDKVRVKPDKDRRKKTGGPPCEWAGCKENATNRAPKGKQNDKDYWHFCLAHAREYNQSYNFFAGMNDAAVLAYQKDALTGHRPTWKMGTGKRASRPNLRWHRHRSVRPVRRRPARRAEEARPKRGRSATPSARRSTRSGSMSAPRRSR